MYKILHLVNDKWGDIGRADDLDGVHQHFMNARVLYGGYVDPINLELNANNGTIYRAVRA